MSPITEHKSLGVGGMEHSIKWKCPNGAGKTEICIICSSSKIGKFFVSETELSFQYV